MNVENEEKAGSEAEAELKEAEQEEQEEQEQEDNLPDPEIVMTSGHLVPGEPNPDTRPADWAVWLARCTAGSRKYNNGQLDKAQRKRNLRLATLNMHVGRGRRRRRLDEDEKAQVLADNRTAKRLQAKY